MRHTLAVRFPDNDFSTTVWAFMENLLSFHGLDALQEISKERIIKLWNLSAVGLYFLC